MTEFQTTCPDPAKWQAAILARIVVDESSGCWNWTGRKRKRGYGGFRYRDNGRRREVGAHRAAYLAFVGDIPAPLVLDHLCLNKACANPGHLEPVTIQANIARATRDADGRLLGIRHSDAIGPTYPCGHPRTDENTLISVARATGYTSRGCRECNRRKVAAWNAKR